MRVLLAAFLVFASVSAGCAAEDLAAASREAPPAAAVACPSGQVMVGLTSAGAASCERPRESLAGFECPRGQAVIGFDGDGEPRCAAFVTPSARAPPPDREVPATSSLKLLNVYGERPSSDAQGLDRILVQIELSAGATPADLSEMLIRFSDGRFVANFDASRFETVWIRGSPEGQIMEPGDLVQIRFEPPEPVPTRMSVQMTLIPETGAPLQVDFKTPPTYGTDTVILLR